jgi:hypothetical protein
MKKPINRPEGYRCSLARNLIFLALLLGLAFGVLAIILGGLTGVILGVLATVFGFSALRRASGEMRVLCYAVVILGLIEVVLYVLQLLIMALTYELITPW